MSFYGVHINFDNDQHIASSNLFRLSEFVFTKMLRNFITIEIYDEFF